MIEDLVIISFDQAKETGYCVSFNGKVTEHGVITSKKDSYEEVTVEIKQAAERLIKKHKRYPILVTIEDLYSGLNITTYKKLARLQGTLITLFLEEQCLYHIIYPTTWQNKLKIKGKDKKKQSKAFASELLDKKITNDNESDAICMNYYARNHIKISQTP